MLPQRLASLQAALPDRSAALLTSAGDITYFSGFQFLVPAEREALLLVTKQSAVLLHAAFSPVHKHQFLEYAAGCHPTYLQDQVQKLQKADDFSVLLIDESSLVVSEFHHLQELSVRLQPLSPKLIWELRSLKDVEEQKAIRAAGEITRTALNTTLSSLRTGDTERIVRDRLEEEFKRLGSGPVAFPTIVAFGEHTALPHHQPSDRTLELNTPVLIDCGATIAGYCADSTRTTWFGSEPSPEFSEISGVVHAAYTAVETLVLQQAAAQRKLPLLAKELDHAARSTITKAGFGARFIHTTGHGVGLDIHEQPSVSSVNTTEIKPGMVLTIEPGIYLENEVGYRHENTVLFTQDKWEELT